MGVRNVIDGGVVEGRAVGVSIRASSPMAEELVSAAVGPTSGMTVILSVHR